jgi:hypothetical protein
MRFALAIALIASSLALQSSREQQLPFSDKAWELTGNRAAIVKEGDRDVLQVETGFAHRKDVSLQDGTIEFDVQVTRRRSFVYVSFREVAEGEREEFYLRPHKSGLPDAVQYAPVWQNRSAWQLHHGLGGTAAVPFEPGAWTRVRVVLQGRHAALFVKDMTSPVLLVPNVAREPKAGSITVGGFLPAGVPGEAPIAKFSNVVVRPDAVPFDFKAALSKTTTSPAQAATQPGETIVRAWSVSRSFVPKPGDTAAIQTADITGEFQRLETEPSGLLELDRHVRIPEKSNVAAAVARIRVRAARAGAYVFDLGFSDIATVFVNGRPFFQGNQSYSFDRPRREGLIGFDQARLHLPLEAGDNEVAVVVSDSFGGWGLMGRFVNARGLSIETP